MTHEINNLINTYCMPHSCYVPWGFRERQKTWFMPSGSSQCGERVRQITRQFKSSMSRAKGKEQTGSKRHPVRGCQWVPFPGEAGESLTKERRLSPGLGSVRWKSLPIWEKIVGKVGEMYVPGIARGSAWLEQRTQWESSKRRGRRGGWGQIMKLLLSWQCLGDLCPRGELTDWPHLWSVLLGHCLIQTLGMDFQVPGFETLTSIHTQF